MTACRILCLAAMGAAAFGADANIVGGPKVVGGTLAASVSILGGNVNVTNFNLLPGGALAGGGTLTITNSAGWTVVAWSARQK